jgi:hypothetical protein
MGRGVEVCGLCFGWVALQATGCGGGGGAAASAAPSDGLPNPVGPDGGYVYADAGSYFDDAGDPDADIIESVTLVSDGFDVPAGDEMYMCQDFANPFHGQQVDVIKHESHMPAGSHHLLLFFDTNAKNSGVSSCSGLEAYPFQYVAQAPNFEMTYPAGVGATIPTSIGFRMNMHYLNTTSETVHAQDRVTMYVAKPGIVTQHAGTIFYSQSSISIPATGQPYTATQTCNITQDMNLLSADSHMHQRATSFLATAAGMTLYTTTQWSDPTLKVYSPPIFLPSGTPITWSCTYVNDTGAALTFGESAMTDVMCIYQGSFYPVSDITNPVAYCLPAGL